MTSWPNERMHGHAQHGPQIRRRGKSLLHRHGFVRQQQHQHHVTPGRNQQVAAVCASFAVHSHCFCVCVFSFGAPHVFSYDYNNALTKVLPSVAASHVAQGGSMVLRRNSGEPVDCVFEGPACVRAGEACFPRHTRAPQLQGATRSSSAWPPYRVTASTTTRCATSLGAVSLTAAGYSLCAVRGTGIRHGRRRRPQGQAAAGLQRVKQGTPCMSFATKLRLSFIVYADGSSREVMKRPKDRRRRRQAVVARRAVGPKRRRQTLGGAAPRG